MTAAVLVPEVVTRADYADAADAQAVVDLLDAYARDPMGGAEPLCDDVRAELVPGLAATPGAFSLIARIEGQPVGLVNCFTAFSTFTARPNVNIHDVIVLPGHRGRGIARAMFAQVEKIARDMGACKVTLEVLEGNGPARTLYAALGYGDYVLDPELGRAMFWQKRLD